MRTLIVCLAAVSAVTAFEINNRRDACSNIVCRAGRECVLSNGIGRCECVSTCSDNFAPVCGTDGNSYDNHCLLHRHACLSESKIGIEHKGFCKTKKKTKEAAKYVDPAVCYGSQRDALLLIIGKHWQKTLATQPWHVSGMTYRESLWGRFYTCDEDRDKFLESDELLNCTSDVLFFARPGQEQELTRALCIDAIVDAADNNRDWRLDFEEFTTMLSPGWHPPQKLCSLEGKEYHDAHKVVVDGQTCVCAVGSWVCTNPVIETNNKKVFKENDFDSYDDNTLDNDIAEDDYYDDEYNDEDNDDDDDDDDEEYLDKLFDEVLEKLEKHKRERNHHNHL
ncbi:Follistatin-related protein 1 [Halocaridina rubra]|uniref:Follistatin-related protein 1 n=1 Tax=Halocaridina rubra TaxID=373956 RepID=A0AAN8XN61_HALRR